MWKCSKCDAMNDGDICSVCGEPRSEETAETTENPTEETEEVVVNTAEETEKSEEESEVVELNEDTDSLSDDNGKWICPVCGAECDGDTCETCGEQKPEESNIVDFGSAKKSGKFIALIAVIAVVVLVTAGIFGWYFFNRNVEGTGENKTVTYEDIMGASDSIFGDDVILKVNGIEIPKKTFEILLTSNALYYQQNMLYTDSGVDLSALDDFKWTDVADKKTGKTHREKVIEDTVNSCIQIYALISTGEKYNVEPAKSDLDSIDQDIKDLKEQYGDDFDSVLKLNGYSSVDDYKEMCTINAQVNAVVNDLQEHPDRYINKDHSVYDMEDLEVISAKHILIKIDEENGVDEKAAKKKANDILKKAKKTKDFDSLVEKYNEDSGQPDEGYTFGKGQMMEEFEKAAFALKPDEISGLVKTDYGYHIIKRVIGYMDVVNYETRNAKVLVNKSELKKFKIKADYKKLIENAEEREQKTQANESEEAEQTETNVSGEAAAE